MSDNVVQIGQAKVSRTRQKKFCEHNHLLYSPELQTVECDDCGQQIGAFKAFIQIVHQMDSAQSMLDHREKELKAMQEKELVLIAAKKMESAWRRRNMVPACPHCGEGILPEDVKFLSSVNKKMTLERRKFKAKS